MSRAAKSRQEQASGKRWRADSGQSLTEVACVMPLLILLMIYAIDFGYFFVAVADITSAARIAAQYSVLGYEGPAQSGLPVAGPASTTTSVTALAMANLTSLVGSSTTTTVQVCTKQLGTTGNYTNCSSYGATGTIYSVGADPEAPRFYLQRVDVTYTVQPPIPVSCFGHSFLPSMKFHRQVSMRAMD